MLIRLSSVATALKALSSLLVVLCLSGCLAADFQELSHSAKVQGDTPDGHRIYTVPVDAQTFTQPALFLQNCLNVLSIKAGDKLLYEAPRSRSGLYNFGNLRQPFISLVGQSSPDLLLEVEPSPARGLGIHCQSLLLGDEHALIQYFMFRDTPPLLMGGILLLLGVIALLARSLLGLPYSRILAILFLTLGGWLILGSQSLNFIHLNNRELYTVWGFSGLMTLALYLLYVHQNLARKPRSLLILASLHAALAVLVTGLLLGGVFELSELLKRGTLILFALEFFAVLPLLGWQIRYSAWANGERVLWLGYTVLGIGLTYRCFAITFNWAPFYIVSLSCLFFIVSALVALLRERLERARALAAQNRSDLEDYTLKLESEVRLRELRLQEKNADLEQLNTELEEKNVLMRLSFKKVDELVAQQLQLLKRASRVKSLQLNALSSDFEAYARTPSRETHRALALTLSRFGSALEPFRQLQRSSEALRNQTVWLRLAHNQTLDDVRLSLGSSHLKLQAFSTDEDLLSALEKEEPRLLILDAECRELEDRIYENYPRLDMILVAESELADTLAQLKSRPRINHVIDAQIGQSPLLQRNLLVTVGKILSQNIFGPEKYLDWGVDLKEQIISGNGARAQALEQLDLDLARFGLSSTQIRKAHHLADELLMNVIYDAPQDPATGQARYNHLHRSVNVELEPSEYARFRYGYDGTLLVISVDDPFGALGRDTLLKYLESCARGEIGKINEAEGKGGGGMGLFQILSSADLLVCNIKPGRRTEVITVLNIQDKISLRSKSFHYFTEASI